MRRVLLALGALATMAAFPELKAQGNYPSKPMRWIVPYAAGGGVDVIARPLALKLADVLGQPIVYENRGGGGGLIAAEFVARSTADGYTLLVAAGNTQVFATLLNDKIGYDPVKDFAPITKFDTTPNVLVSHPAFPPRNIQELVAHGKANPGSINWASSGNGAGSHLSLILFAQQAGIKVIHVPYKGGGPATTAVLAGESDLVLTATAIVLPQIKSGKLRALGFAGSKRLVTLPDVPTIDESGFPGFDSSNFRGLMAPAGTAQSIITRLHGELAKIIHSPETVTRMTASGSIPVGNTPQQFAEENRREVAIWSKIIRENNIKVD